jgi:NCAIR mutase (PurE)-related protein
LDRDTLKRLLEEVSDGKLDVDQALSQLKDFPYKDLGFARVDLHRTLRKGFPEVIFGQGKQVEHILAIAQRIVEHGGPLLVTRVSPEAGRALLKQFPDGIHDATGRTFHLDRRSPEDLGRGKILVVAAGTSDLPVAEEAALTAQLMGNRVERLYDVGVAGIHRLLGDRQALQEAEVLIVVAGMEGALPSVVGGLVDRPVVAVPTSIGSGASFNGLAALLGMLNSCAAGVTVVNIDNGFGAGYAAALMNRKREEEK